MARGELETGAREAAVFGGEEAYGVRGKFVAIGRWGGYKGMGAMVWNGREVTAPHAVGLIFAGDERGLGGGRERGGVGSSSVLKKSQTWKTGPFSRIPKETYSTRKVRTRKEVRKIRCEIVSKVWVTMFLKGEKVRGERTGVQALPWGVWSGDSWLQVE